MPSRAEKYAVAVPTRPPPTTMMLVIGLLLPCPIAERALSRPVISAASS